jgi:signal transduction histidine kinase
MGTAADGGVRPRAGARPARSAAASHRTVPVLVGGVLAGVAATAALLYGGYSVPVALAAPTLALNLAVGWSFVGIGAVARARRPDNRTGLLMVVLGFAFFARFAVAVARYPAFVVGVLVGSLYLSVFLHLLVAFPTGRLTTWPQRAAVAVGYLLSTPLDAFFLLAGATREPVRSGLPPNGLVIVPAPVTADVDPVDLTVQVVVLVLCTSVLVIVGVRFRRAGPAERRAIWPALLGGALIVVALMVQRAAFVLRVPPDLWVLFTWKAHVVLVAWPMALLFGLFRSRLDRGAVSRLLVELGAGPPAPERLRAVLAATLHDPSVEVAYWLPDRAEFVDARGDPVVVPRPGRAVTYLDGDGARIAALVHDRALADEPELVEAVAAGARMALENERLHAEVRAQLREVQASRARIVESADAARRRVERDLHDGAQQRLVTVALALRLARSRLASAPAAEVDALLRETGEELAAALDELRELARGIYPVLLTDAGLGPAVTALAERSPVPAVVAAVPARRLPEVVEQAGYFVVSEALANVAKHARATRVVVEARVGAGEAGGGDTLLVEVVDDGVGGAHLRGPGLGGLADRVAAAGGRLRVTSPPGGGTRVTAELPCR